MNAKKCDRCHKFYEPYKGKNMLIFAEENRALDYVEESRYEVCPQCLRDILYFIKCGGGPQE